MTPIPLTSTRHIAHHVFWLLVLQGISFVVLGVLVILYPFSLFVIISTAFIWVGVTTLIVADRVRRLRNAFPLDPSI